MNRPLRILTLLIGTVWSQVLLVAGVTLIFLPMLQGGWWVMGLGLIGGGALVAMLMVIDPLVPEAGPGIVQPLKFAAALAFLMGGGLSVVELALGPAWL